MSPRSKTLWRRTLLLLLVGAVLGYVFIIPYFYWSDATEVRVVDVDTKQPLEGVIVVAVYELYFASMGRGYRDKAFHVIEAVTDWNGRAHLPAWGPKRVPESRHFGPLVFGPFMDSRNPQLILIKDGYGYDMMSSSTPKGHADHYYRIPSVWTGLTLVMRRFESSRDRYANHLAGLDYALDRVYADDYQQCLWKNMPKTVVTLDQFSKTLAQDKLYPLARQFHRIENLPHQAECGDAAEYFKQYQP